MSAPTFCWQCGKKLMRRNGAPVFALMMYGGVEHRVHKECKAGEPREATLSHNGIKASVRKYLSGERVMP